MSTVCPQTYSNRTIEGPLRHRSPSPQPAVAFQLRAKRTCGVTSVVVCGPPKEAPCGLLAPPGAWRCDNHPVLGADLLHAFGNTPDLQGAACLAHRDLFNRCTEPGASAELPAGDPDMSARVPRLRPVPGLGRKLPLVLLRTALRTGEGQTYSECVVEGPTYSECVVEGPHLPSTRHRCSGSSGAVEAAQ